MSDSEQYDVVVVGGGAAGVFGAIAAARAGASVLCLEGGSQPLRKVRISGGGRCNVMHDAQTWQASRDAVAQRYPRGADQLLGSLASRFSPEETQAWFEAEGVQLKVEADGRAFPTTDDSATIIDALLGAAERAGVVLRTRAKVSDLAHDSGAAPPRFGLKYASASGGETAAVRCSAVLLSTGSSAHGLAAGLGHRIVPLIPSLFSFRLCAGGVLDATLAGVSVPDVELSLELKASESGGGGGGGGRGGGGGGGGRGGGKGRGRGRGGRSRTGGGGGPSPSLSSRGPLLVTHRGVSGPAALKLSAFAAVELAEAGYAGALKLNLLPALSGAGVVGALEAFTVDGRRKLVRNANPFGLPGRLWEAVACGGGDEAEATGAKRWGELRRAEVEALSSRLTATPLPFSGKDSNKDEFVTCGGVDWRDVDATQMQSRLVPGLFFAGEVLDVDGVTGGHNFQSCWTTGHVAGSGAAEHAAACSVAPEAVAPEAGAAADTFRLRGGWRAAACVAAAGRHTAARATLCARPRASGAEMGMAPDLPSLYAALLVDPPLQILRSPLMLDNGLVVSAVDGVRVNPSGWFAVAVVVANSLFAPWGIVNVQRRGGLGNPWWRGDSPPLSGTDDGEAEATENRKDKEEWRR